MPIVANVTLLEEGVKLLESCLTPRVRIPNLSVTSLPLVPFDSLTSLRFSHEAFHDDHQSFAAHLQPSPLKEK